MNKNQIDIHALAQIAINAAQKGGAAIMEVYNTADFQVDFKSDNSPLTIADKRAHAEIAAVLAGTNIPVLSEEGKSIPFEERSKWDYFWMVDPLDGTKEFIKRNGEFTVNIALIHQNRPVMGVVHTPALDETCYGIEGSGAWKLKGTEKTAIKTSGRYENEPNLKVVASRSHMSPETEAFISKLENPELVSMGSSLKILLLADGSADVYPRYAPTMEWDTAAAHAVLRAAGGKILQYETNYELEYNKENLLNPWFLALAY